MPLAQPGRQPGARVPGSFLQALKAELSIRAPIKSPVT